MLSVLQYALLMDEINKEIQKIDLGIEISDTSTKLACLLWMDASRTSSIYSRALAIMTRILRKQHPVYLRSFSATQAEYMLWHWAFPKLFVGCSWLTTADVNHWPML